MLAYRNNWGEDRVMYRDAADRIRALPASWTSVVAADPYVTLSAGRSLFRLPDLLSLVTVMQAQRSCEEADGAAGKPARGVK